MVSDLLVFVVIPALSCLHRHRMAVGLLSASLVVAVAYCIACNSKGWNTPQVSFLRQSWARHGDGVVRAQLFACYLRVAMIFYYGRALG